ncbi:MAG: hypothetical protein IBJ03_14340 [Gemmatimonadaceae bacterium]|nr:hypothetical protein [Gemmatimonadaceae bacterium]
MFSFTVRPTRTHTAMAIATAMLSLAAPAEAQLGKLKKMGGDLVKDAAKDKIEGKKDTPAKPASGSASSSSSARSTELVLNEDRVALIVASLQPMVADAARRRELRVVTAQHEQKTKASQACIQAAQAKMGAAPPMTTAANMQKNEATMDRYAKQIEGLSARMTAAVNANDVRKRIYTSDSLMVIQVKISLLVTGSNCAVEHTPAPILDEQIRSQSRTEVSEDMDAGTFDPPAVAKENLTKYQFGLLRERIAIWALKQEDPTFKAGKPGIFTPEEEAALQANAADIKKLTPLFKDNSLRWSTWGDLSDW